MAEVIHITENANQPAARVSALSLSELSVLIGNSLPTVDPLVLGSLWNDEGIVKSSPTPIVVSDFKNAVYLLNGVTKTYADLWDAPIGHLALVTDVGLVQDYHGTANVSGTATANATLFDVVQPQLGYSGVIDITPTWDPAQQANPSFYCSTGLFAHSPNLAFELEVFPDVQHGQLFTNDIQLNTAADALLNGVSNRFAYTATPTLLAISINGGPVITAANSGDYSGIDFLGLSVFQSAGSGFKSIIEKLKLYPPLSSSLLPSLST